jgi:2-iminoacetate synthase
MELRVTHFSIEPGTMARRRERAAKRARNCEGSRIVARIRDGERLDDDALAALLLDGEVDTEELLGLAREFRPECSPIETFSPLYLSNECDAECLMCGMRGTNPALERETADDDSSREQLDILFRRGIRGVALLTGEYRHGRHRSTMLRKTAMMARYALDRGFRHVLINIGSLEAHEYGVLLEGMSRTREGMLEPHVTMCTFQETYDPGIYARFMGSSPDNPRSDFERRLRNFDRAADAGMRSANPGLLLGLNRDLAFEMLALLAHVRHLSERGMEVYISLPRLRKASGTVHRAGVDDDGLLRIASLLSVRFPASKIVISTREAPEIQHRLLPVIGVLTAGSPGVSPYTESGARFDPTASQFEVADQRPFEVILGECLAAGFTIDGYEPAAPAQASGG